MAAKGPAWLTSLAPIFTNFSRSVVSDQCSTFFGKAESPLLAESVEELC